MPTVDWVLLGSGEPNKRQELGSLHLQLVCGRTLPLLAGKACNSNNLLRIKDLTRLPICYTGVHAMELAGCR